MCIKIDKILYVVFFTPNTPNERVARYEMYVVFFTPNTPNERVAR